MLTIIPALTFLGISFGQLTGPSEIVLAQQQLSLANRQPVPYINEIFKKNILLNLNYLDKRIKKEDQINWSEVEKPFTMEFKLNPGQTFAFHDDILPEYKERVTLTTNAHFNSQEGFISDGYLVGDGVCHLASIISWAAKDAHLDVKAPTRHDFATITDVPKEYGVSIYSNPYAPGSSTYQNLYITNNLSSQIEFKFEYKNDILNVKVVEIN